MADDEVTPLSAPTANYGWAKPAVGADLDAWGGMLNTDLDGIDSVVHGIQTTALGDNRIINGDMRIDQRNNGAVVVPTATIYTLDRWQALVGQPSKLAFSRQGGAPQPAGFTYYLYCQSQSAYASIASDLFVILQTIEADMIADFAWGTANAQPVTLSFWAFSTKTGTFSGSVANNGQGSGRSYPFTYSIPVATTWTRIVVTIPGDTGGTWSLQGNGVGLGLHFDLGTGTTYRGSANTWGSAYYVGVTGAQSIVATNAASFAVAGVKLEIGSVATPFNRQSLAKSLADCERYYQNIAIGYRSYASVSSTINAGVVWPQMRIAPTCTLITAGTRSNTGAVALSAYQKNSGFFQLSPPAAGDAYALNDLWSLAAEL